MPRPYFRSGGAMLISHGLKVPCCEAPQKIRMVPNPAKKAVVTPKKPT